MYVDDGYRQDLGITCLEMPDFYLLQENHAAFHHHICSTTVAVQVVVVPAQRLTLSRYLPTYR